MSGPSVRCVVASFTCSGVSRRTPSTSPTHARVHAGDRPGVADAARGGDLRGVDRPGVEDVGVLERAAGAQRPAEHRLGADQLR